MSERAASEFFTPSGNLLMFSPRKAQALPAKDKGIKFACSSIIYVCLISYTFAPVEIFFNHHMILLCIAYDYSCADCDSLHDRLRDVP